MDMKRVSQKRVRRVLAFLLVFIMAFMLAGCGSPGEDMASTGEAEKNIVEDVAMGDYADEAAPGEGGTEITGDGADTGAASDIAGIGIAEDYSLASDDFASAKLDSKAEGAGEAEADTDIEAPEELPPTKQEIEAKAGTLTAGEWDDNDNWGFYKNLFAKSSDYYSYKISWGMTFVNRIRVKVTDGGNAVKLAKVSLLDERKQVIWGSVSRYDGYADLFYATDKNNMSEPRYIRVEKDGKTQETELKAKRINVEEDEDGQNSGAGGGNGISQPSYEFDSEYTVELSGTKTNSKKLDLMFLVDTTGSMSDEITFLQTELKDVISTVKQNNSNIPIRISMNFYKDEGDSYVVDSHEFISDIDEAQRLINAEYAEGGGDYPEAVHTALRDAVYNHKWDDDSVKVMFILLDAPPHDGVDESLADSLKKAGSEGIHIIPVAASGIDKKTEFLLRAMAISTDGTYVFLTDDSGVGGSHIAPTVGDYDVELLNELMIRLINKYIG